MALKPAGGMDADSGNTGSARGMKAKDIQQRMNEKQQLSEKGSKGVETEKTVQTGADVSAYETVIGLEVHVELATKSKIFCACSAEFGAAPNVHTCPVCTGMPGSLPVLNRQVLAFALKAGLALGCDIQKNCRFDRKHYFYPDNPQNYQISQLYVPVCRGGGLTIAASDGTGTKRIRIHELHMEEDAGKLLHDAEHNCSYVDYNRSGVPLIEIVTEPDLRTAEEVICFLEKLRLVLQYLGVSDCRMNEGSMRVDVNLSVRRLGEQALGVRTEMKNLNSFRSVIRAIQAESERQLALLASGQAVFMETRRFDESTGSSQSMRSKEELRDYRYFPEPDLPPLAIAEEWIEALRKEQPELREEKQARYVRALSLPEYDAEFLTGNKALSVLFEEAVSAGVPPKEASNYLMVEGRRILKEQGLGWEDIHYRAEQFCRLTELVQRGEINRAAAKMVFCEMFLSDADVEAYVLENGLKVENDSEKLAKLVQEILAKNPQSVADYKAGKQRAMGFLVGQGMRAANGRADPQLLSGLIRAALEQL